MADIGKHAISQRHAKRLATCLLYFWRRSLAADNEAAKLQTFTAATALNIYII